MIYLHIRKLSFALLASSHPLRYVTGICQEQAYAHRLLCLCHKGGLNPSSTDLRCLYNTALPNTDKK